MISFSTWGKKLLHDFLSCNLWVKVSLNESIVEKYGVFIQKHIRDEKHIYLMFYIQSFRSLS